MVAALKGGLSEGRDKVAAYEADLCAWVDRQVLLLRAGRVGEIDARLIAEELSDVGSEQYEKLESAFAVLLMHMLKWDHQPERRSRSWDNTIAEQRRRITRVLARNPSLKARVAEAIAEGYLDGRDRASTEIDVPRSIFPEACPFGLEDILTRPFSFETAGSR